MNKIKKYWNKFGSGWFLMQNWYISFSKKFKEKKSSKSKKNTFWALTLTFTFTAYLKNKCKFYSYVN